MNAKLGPGSDNARPVVGRRSLTIDSPTVLPSQRRGPSEALVAAVALAAVLLMFGAGWASVRHLSGTSQTPSAGSANTCTADGSQGCRKIEGLQGLLWVFTPTPPFSEGECHSIEPREDYGEREVWQCQWADIDAQVLISRWDQTASAERYFSWYFGDPMTVDVAPGDGGGLEFSSLTPRESDQPGYAFSYVARPYSVLILGPQIERDRAMNRLHKRDPAQIGN